MISRITLSLNRIMAVGLVLIKLALGLIFIYSALEKLAHPQDFLATVYDFRLTGPLLGFAVAIIMPWLELLLGLALLSGVFPGGALLVASALGALFLVVQASAILRGLSVSCGCFGPDEAHMVGKGTFLRTALIFFAALVAWYGHYHRSAAGRKRTKRVEDEFGPPIGVRRRKDGQVTG